MTLPRSWRMLFSAGCCLLCLASAAHAQETDAPAPDDPREPVFTEPKTWYPRLTGLPVTYTDQGTLFLAGEEYDAGRFLVAFFDTATDDQIRELLANFQTASTEQSSRSNSFYLTLAESQELFPAVDFFNDSPLVRTAMLLRVLSSGEDKGVPPSPLYPPTDAPEPAAGFSPRESLWPGDADGNYSVTIADATLALRTSVGLYEPTPLAFARMDINRNLRVDVGDVTLTLALSVGRGLPPPYGYSR